MTLLIHTSSPTVHVGLADGDQIVARDEFPVTRALASSLAERIRAFLQATSHQLPALREVVVHAGPGGFTSLRIGVTTANTLAYALKLPIVGVTGPVASLDELLRRAGTAEHAAGNLVLPVYDREPHIGPVRTP